MATEIIKTIKPSGGDYTSLSAWEAARQRDLVAVDEIEIAECYPFEDTTPCTISGWTTDATRKIIIRTPSGYKHGGKWNTNSYRMSVGNASPLTISVGHCLVDGLQGTAFPGYSNGSTGAFKASLSAPDTTCHIIFRNCIAGDTNAYSNVGGGAFQITYTASGTTFSVTFVNCLVHNTMWYTGFTNSAPAKATAKAYNCTCAKSSGSQFTSVTTYNCISGTDGVVFVDAANGDYHLSPSDTIAKGTGTNYSSAISALSLPVQDIDEQTITTWSKGVDAQATVIVVEPPTFEGMYLEKKKTVWTPKDRIDRKQATTGLPAWSHGNDNFTKLMLDGGSATDISAGYQSHPYQVVSGYFDGTGTASNVLTVQSSDFATGTGDFCIRGSAYFTSITNSPYVFKLAKTGFTENTNDVVGLTFGSTQISLNWNNVAGLTASYIVPLNTWIDWSVSRSGGHIRVYVDNVLRIDSTTGASYSISHQYLVVGGFSTSSTYNMNGYMADVEFATNDRGHTGSTTPKQILPIIADSSTTKLLLPMRTLGTTFTDSSTGNKTMGNPGTATQIFYRHPYYSTTGYFDGSGDYLSIPASSDFNLGTGDFTIEGWFNNPTANTTMKTLFSLTSTTNGLGLLIGVDNGVANQVLFNVSSNDSSWDIINGSGQGAYSANSWVHVAAVRSGNTFYLFVNGTQTYTNTSSLAVYFPNAPLVLGARTSTSISQLFTGYMADWRVTKGFARYTSNFSVPTSPLVADSYTKLLLPMNEGMKPIAYDSTKQKSIACGSSLTVRNYSRHPYQTVAAYFDGNTDYITIPTSTDFDLQGDFTLECWYNFSVTTGNHVFFNRSTRFDTDMANSSYRFMFASNNLYWNWNNAGSIGETLAPFTPTVNTWYHIAMVRNGNNLLFFVNGVLILSSSMTVNPVIKNRVLEIGSVPGLTWNSTGFMSDVRISNNARYTTNFTPTVLSYEPTNTKLLLPMSTVGTTFYESTGKNPVVTGDVKQIVCNFGNGKAFIFDGTVNSRLMFNAGSECTIGTNSFTMEGWVSVSAQGTTQGFIVSGPGSSYPPVQFAYYSTNQLWVWISENGTSWALNSGGINVTLTNDVWYHYALVRNGTNLQLYINGTSVYSTTYSGNITSYGSNPFCLGGYTDNLYNLNGKYGWFHFVNGFALYTANFTPPALPTITKNSKVVVMPGESATSFNDYSSVSAPKSITVSGDAKQTNKVITNSGVTFVPDSTCPVSGRTMNFNGTSSALTYSSAGMLDYTKDFTIDAWYYKYAAPSSNAAAIFEHNDNNSTGPMVYITNHTNGHIYATMYMSSGCYYNWVTSSIPANGAWYHLAFVKQGNECFFFLNGTLQTMSNNTVGAFTNPTSQPFTGRNQPSNGWLNGRVTQLRLSQIARWTRNFTPPKMYTNN